MLLVTKIPCGFGCGGSGSKHAITNKGNKNKIYFLIKAIYLLSLKEIGRAHV